MKHSLNTGSARGAGPIVDAALAARHAMEHLPAGAATAAHQRAQLEHALAVAAAAEERIAEQNRRIAFLESLSRTDELTGLLNRRGFVEELRRALALARRSGETGVLIFGDIDGFKKINDVYGHGAGDDVLRRLGRAIAAEVREGDAVARLGGDEFVVLLARTGLRDGSKRARLLQRGLDRLEYPCGAASIRVGVSLGVEPYGPHDDPDDLLARADMAMYCNKRRKASTQLRTVAAAE